MGDDFRMTAENCSWLVRKIWHHCTRNVESHSHEKSEKHQLRAPAHGQATLISIQRKITSDIFVI